jgi:hypothetical protein
MTPEKNDESLKRLGGGRWQTRDGRFTIEPQSGTWVILDGEQTDDLGLPLVRGPFKSLTDARAAVEGARESPAPSSPLAGRLKEAHSPKKGSPKTELATSEAPKEPRWLAQLSKAERERAKKLVGLLSAGGARDPEDLVRDDIDRGTPTVARFAIARRMAELVAKAGDKPDARALTRELAVLLGSGRDDDLGVSWRMVDGDGRPIDATGRELRAALDRAGRKS